MSDPEVLTASPSPGDDHRKRELDLREREVAAYEREITAKEAEINKSPWLNPLVIGLLVAVIGLLGSVVVTRMNNQTSQRVELFRAQSILVAGAISTYHGKACDDLLSLNDLKLLDDTIGAVQVCKNQRQQARDLAGQSNLVNAPLPLIAKGGAPIGTKYQSKYKKNDLECVNETAKVSATEWQERTSSSDSPAGCQVDAVIFPYTERESNDPQYFLLYDESRNLFARLPNVAVGGTGPSDWRLVSNQTWNAGRSVTRVN
jgi:hypothetical protein